MRRKATKPKPAKRPSTKGKTKAGDGRDPASGRFLPGWKGGPGGDQYGRQRELRAKFHEAVTAQEMEQAVRRLVRQALAGKPWALRVLFDRYWGRPPLVVKAMDDANVRPPEELEFL